MDADPQTKPTVRRRQRVKNQLSWRIAIIIVSLLFTALACGTGTTTTHTQRGNQGQVVVNINSAEGSDQTEIEINEDYSWETVTVNISVVVESGSYRATFVDDDQQSVTLEAAAGNPATAQAQMATDAFGSLTLNSEASGAQGVVITIDYTNP
jgi:hypothetical protein